MGTSHKPIRIAILGAGFGGLYAYLGLHARLHKKANFEITLISDQDYFLFVTLIHEVATGTLLPVSITQSIRTIPLCGPRRFIHGKVTAADFDSRRVSVEKQSLSFPDGRAGPSTPVSEEFSYDYLVLALGSDSKFVGTPGAREHALTLKNLKDAETIKNRMIDSFEHASRLTSADDQKDALRFVIVGGGPTGLELAGEMADYINDEFAAAFPDLRDRARVVVLQGADRLVPQVAAWFDKKARRILAHKMGVGVRYNTRVSKVTSEGVEIGDEFLKAATVIWTAGVQARPLPIEAKKHLEYDERSGRIKVTNALAMPTYPEVFVVGDQAWVHDKETGQPYPMRAQFAQRQGDVAAENIVRSVRGEPLKEFEWRDQGFILSLGKGGALAEVFGFHFSGFFAWWLYRAANASKIVGARAKMRTILDWLLGLFFPRDLSKF